MEKFKNSLRLIFKGHFSANIDSIAKEFGILTIFNM